MSLSNAIENTIEGWTSKWGTRLHNFTSGIIRWGIEQMLDVLGTAASPIISPMLRRIESIAAIPPELQPFFNEIKNPSGEIASVLATQAGGAIAGGALNKILDALFLPFSYDVNSKLHPALPGIPQLVAYWLRGMMSDSDLTNYLHQLGANDLTIQVIKELSQDRLDANSVIKLWLRDKRAGEAMIRDLTDSGISLARIDILKLLAEVLPNAQDVIRFAVREVYTPEIAQRFGQFEDFPDAALPDAGKVGVSAESMRKYWAAHWELPGISQGFEMLHRGAITADDLGLLLKALDVMPFWRDKLTKISYTPYARVDARRMWDLGVLDDAELKRAYLDIGYDDEHSNQMVLWTKIYQTFPDLIARYKNGYINLEQVKSKLLAFGLPEDRANFLIEAKVKPEQPARIAIEKALTKAEVLKGLYKGVISEADANALLKDMGYDDNEIAIIIAINMPASSTASALKAKELSKADIIKEYQTGLITPDAAIAKLVGIRYTQGDAQDLVALADATKKTITNPKQKELTKADIITGVKKAIITAEDGYLMLQDIGYSADDANFILLINIPAATGSPDTYAEFLQITQSYAKAVGLPSKTVPPELIQSEWDLKAADIIYKSAKGRGVIGSELDALQKTLNDAQYKYNRMLSQYRGGK